MQVRNINFRAKKRPKLLQPLWFLCYCAAIVNLSLVFSVMIKTPTTPFCLNVTFNVSDSLFFALAFSPLSLLNLLSVHRTLFVVSISLEFSIGFLANSISRLSFLFQYVDLHFSFSSSHFFFLPSLSHLPLFLFFCFLPLCFCFFFICQNQYYGFLVSYWVVPGLNILEKFKCVLYVLRSAVPWAISHCKHIIVHVLKPISRVQHEGLFCTGLRVCIFCYSSPRIHSAHHRVCPVTELSAADTTNVSGSCKTLVCG